MSASRAEFVAAHSKRGSQMKVASYVADVAKARDRTVHTAEAAYARLAPIAVQIEGGDDATRLD